MPGKGRQFVKGQSGNPGGRPKAVAEVKDLAREHTADAIATLSDIMRDKDKSAAARVSAANSLLERAWGKAETTANVNVKGNVRDLSTAEILAALAASGAIGEEASGDEPSQLH